MGIERIKIEVSEAIDPAEVAKQLENFKKTHPPKDSGLPIKIDSDILSAIVNQVDGVKTDEIKKDSE